MHRLMRSVCPAIPAALAIASLGLIAPAPAHAAILTGAYTDITALNSTADLTALGTTDWAYWNSVSNSTVSGVPTNEKSGGTAIGSIAPVGAGSVRGSTSATKPEVSYSFTDGVSPVSGSVTKATGLFNTSTETVGAGVSAPVTLATTDTYTVYVWAAGFDGVVEFRALLSGAADFVNTTLVGDAAGDKDAALYTLTVKPDTAGAVLTVRATLFSDVIDANSASNVLISGVAVSVVPVVVPAPAAVAAGLPLLALIGVRRPRAAARH